METKGPLVVDYCTESGESSKLFFPWNCNLQKILLDLLPLARTDDEFWRYLLQQAIIDHGYGTNCWSNDRHKLILGDQPVPLEKSFMTIHGKPFHASAILVFDMFFNSGSPLSVEHLYISLQFLNLLPRVNPSNIRKEVIDHIPNEENKKLLSKLIDHEDPSIRELAKFFSTCLEYVVEKKCIKIKTNYD